MSLINTPNFRNPNAEHHLNVVLAYEFNTWAEAQGSSLRLHADKREYAGQHVLNFRNNDKYSSSFPPRQLEEDFIRYARDVLKFNIKLKFIATNPISSLERYGLIVTAIERDIYQTHDELCKQYAAVGMDDQGVCGYGEYTVVRNGWIMGTRWGISDSYTPMTRETVHLGYMTDRYSCQSPLHLLSRDNGITEQIMNDNTKLKVGDILSTTLPDVMVENLLFNFLTRKDEA